MVDTATTLAEVEEHLTGALWGTVGHHVDVDLKGDDVHDTSLESAKDVARGLIDASSEFPGAHTLRSVSVEQLAKSSTYAHVEDGSRIVFKLTWHRVGRRQTYLRSLEKGRKSKFHPAKTPAAIAFHEFVHVVTAALPDWITHQQIPGHERTTLWQQLRQRLRTPNATEEKLSEEVSGYAKKNATELAAEAGSDVYENGRVNPASVTLYDRLKAAHRYLDDTSAALEQALRRGASRTANVAQAGLTKAQKAVGSLSGNAKRTNHEGATSTTQARASPGPEASPQPPATRSRSGKSPQSLPARQLSLQKS